MYVCYGFSCLYFVSIKLHGVPFFVTEKDNLRLYLRRMILISGYEDPIVSHQNNVSVCFIPPYTPLLYSKTGVYRGMHYILIFALKHIL